MNPTELIGRGRTADVYSYGEGKILKLYKSGFPVEAVEEEYVISQFVYSLGLTVPQVYEKVDSEGRTGIVFEYVHGPTLLQQISVKPWSAASGARLMAELHYRLHQQEVKLNRNQKNVLREAIGDTDLLEAEEKRNILEYMDALPGASMLLHGDLHPDNILIGEQARVIDWTNGLSGDPAGDVARTVLLLSHGSMPEGIPAFQRGIIQGIRICITNAYLKRYLKISGLTLSEVDRWMLPIAAARLVEGIPEAEKQVLVKLIRKRLNRLS